MKILCLCEGVTFVHVLRPLLLTKEFPTSDVHIASTFFPPVLEEELKDYSTYKIEYAVSAEAFVEELSNGRSPYDLEGVERCVEEDLRLIDEVKPDLIVHDFRMSAPISARVRSLPWVSISNIVWSPSAIQKLIPPENALVKVLGFHIVQTFFRLFSSWILGKIIKPFNTARNKRGLSSFQTLFEMYTSGDLVAYCDIEEILPHHPLPPHHLFVGPILYTIPSEVPSWLEEYKNSEKTLLVALGSSGNIENLATIVQAFKDMPIKVVIVTGGRSDLSTDAKNIRIVELVDLQLLLPYTSVFINNGGSPTNYLALSYGVPILGLPHNMDQYLSINAIKDYGAAEYLRSGLLTARDLRSVYKKLVSSPSYKVKAKELAKIIATYNPAKRFKEAIERLMNRDKK